MSNISITISNLTEAAAAAVLARLQGTPVDVPAGASAAPAAAPAAAPKARTRAKPAEESAPAPAAAPAVQAPPADDLKKVAIQKLVTLINANDALGRNGKQVCTDLCNTFGGRNISAISADKYPAVIAAVDKALASLNEDPTA